MEIEEERGPTNPGSQSIFSNLWKVIKILICSSEKNQMNQDEGIKNQTELSWQKKFNAPGFLVLVQGWFSGTDCLQCCNSQKGFKTVWNGQESVNFEVYNWSQGSFQRYPQEHL